MRYFWVALLMASSTPCLPLQEVITEIRDSDSVIQTRVLPPSSFNVIDMMDVAKQFVATEGVTHKVAALSIYGDRAIAAEEGGVHCEGGYRQWRVYFDKFPKQKLAVADVISIGKNSVLRLRTPEGSVIRRVVSGVDPTSISVNGIEAEILSVSGRVRSRFEGCEGAGTIEPVLNVRSASVLADDIARQMTSALASVVGTKYIWVSLRNDEWFLCGQYGIQYPFSALAQPPSEEQHFRASEYTCGVLCGGELRCVGPALKPPR